MNVTVTQINTYPVKSCQGISQRRAVVAERGLQYDREWMVINEAGRFLSQREVPGLCLIHTAITAEVLKLSAPTMPNIDVPLERRGGKGLAVTVHEDTTVGVYQGKEVAVWLSEFLGRRCRLVRMPRDTIRPAKSAVVRVAYADAYSFMLLGEASLEDLNRRLREKNEQPLPMNRFRPNIVVTGSEPYAEDRWGEIVVNGVGFIGTTGCQRCVTTTINQATSEKGAEPLATLSTYRGLGNTVLFGRNMNHLSVGVIHVGDGVTLC